MMYIPVNTKVVKEHTVNTLPAVRQSGFHAVQLLQLILPHSKFNNAALCAPLTCYSGCSILNQPVILSIF